MAVQQQQQQQQRELCRGQSRHQLQLHIHGQREELIVVTSQPIRCRETMPVVMMAMIARTCRW